jgi:hypothetical protein
LEFFEISNFLKIFEIFKILEILKFFENFTANAVSVAIGDNGNRLVFEMWWNFFYDLFSNGPKFREPQHINWKHNFKIIMDAVEDYARRWIKRGVDQDPELETLSDWVRTIRSNEVGLYVVLLEVLLFMPNSLIRHSK